jgi:hypothetical protein
MVFAVGFGLDLLSSFLAIVFGLDLGPADRAYSTYITAPFLCYGLGESFPSRSRYFPELSLFFTPTLCCNLI